MGTTVEAPPPRNYYNETASNLQAQVDLAPQLYAAEAQFRPQYTELDLQQLAQVLRGTENNTGLLDLYKNELYPALAEAQNRDRQDRTAGELDIIRRYSGDVTQALRDSAGTSGLINTLQQQAADDLNAGYELNPAQRREFEQSVRSAQSARGLGLGTSDALMEAVTLGNAGEQRRRQRQQFAQSVIGTSQAAGADPFLALFGRPSQTVGAAQALSGQAYGINSNSGAGLFNPESQYGADIFSQNNQNALAANTASAANRTALMGAGIDAAGSVASM